MKLVLIDDDPLIRQSWAFVARRRGDDLIVCETTAGLPVDLDRETPIYLDYSLRGEENGLEFARKLIGRGYRKVFLVTGMPLDARQLPPGLAGLLGKGYPSELHESESGQQDHSGSGEKQDR